MNRYLNLTSGVRFEWSELGGGDEGGPGHWACRVGSLQFVASHVGTGWVGFIRDIGRKGVVWENAVETMGSTEMKEKLEDYWRENLNG